jgi:hypothetical protein
VKCQEACLKTPASGGFKIGIIHPGIHIPELVAEVEVAFADGVGRVLAD